MPKTPGTLVSPNSAQDWLTPKYLNFVRVLLPHMPVPAGAALVEVVVALVVAEAVPGRLVVYFPVSSLAELTLLFRQTIGNTSR